MFLVVVQTNSEVITAELAELSVCSLFEIEGLHNA